MTDYDDLALEVDQHFKAQLAERLEQRRAAGTHLTSTDQMEGYLMTTTMERPANTKRRRRYTWGAAGALVAAAAAGIAVLVVAGNDDKGEQQTPVTQPPGPARNGRIAFMMQEGTGDVASFNLYSVLPDGTELTKVTTTGTSGDPTWTADARRIVYAQGGDIFSRAPDGTGTVPVTTGDPEDFEPAASPDGWHVAFVRVVDGGPGSIWTVGLDGRDLKEVVPLPAGTGPGEGDGAPAFSPDGSQLVYARAGALFIADVATGTERQLVPPSDHAYRPGWSPDGTRIVYGADENNPAGNGGRNIFVVNTDGSGRTALTHETNDFWAADPAWSPDGTKIVYVRFHGGNYVALTTMNADGSSQVEIWHPEAGHDIFPNRPAWGTGA